jgi:colicin import membrane protein
MPDWMIPEPDVRILKVQLVTAKNVKQAKKKVEKKNTQQSSAPAQPKKKKKKQVKKKPKHKTKVITPKNLKKKKQIKKEQPKKAPQKKIEENKSIARPEKLDKTKNKKTVIKDKSAPKKTASQEDDFLKTLDFIKDLKTEGQIAHKQDDIDDTPKTLTNDDYTSIAILKKHIEKNWFRPPGIKDLDKLSIQIEVEINKDGTIEDLQLVKSSGQQFFDNSLLRAVRKSVPLPLPGERYDVFKTIELYFNG